MRKRGQVYLLVAIILGFVLFVLYSKTNIVRKTVVEDDFEELSKNYEIESSKFVNTLLKVEKEVGNAFKNFTVLFTSYSKTKNPDFGLIYAFDYQDKLYVGNYLNQSITVKKGVETKQLQGCYDKVKTSISVGGLSLEVKDIDYKVLGECTWETNSIEGKPTYLIYIIINDIEYEIEVISRSPELVIVSRETKGADQKVYTKGRFKKGTSLSAPGQEVEHGPEEKPGNGKSSDNGK